MSSNRVRSRKGFLLLSLLAVVMTVMVGGWLWHNLQGHSMQLIRGQIEEWRPIFIGIRWALITILSIGWSPLCCWLADKGYLTTKNTTQLQNGRWRVIGWLLVMELIVGQNLIARLLSRVGASTG